MNEVIRIKNLHRDFHVGEVTVSALKSIDLTVNSNEFIAIMGPSGSGKSTFLNILGCLDTPTSGEYWLDNKKVNELDNTQLANIRNQKIGFIFQNFNLLSNYSALQNVMLPLVYAGFNKQERIDMAMEALEKVQLGNRYMHKPNQLSGGERQRVAIARALINKPSLILADEPTGNLDSVTSKEIVNNILKVHQDGNTILMVTHDSKVASIAERTVNMSDGGIV